MMEKKYCRIIPHSLSANLAALSKGDLLQFDPVGNDGPISAREHVWPSPASV